MPVLLFGFSNPPLPFLTISLPPQALYKLYNVAANHRHLYHHAFPGHQVEEPAEEQDRKRDWRDGGHFLPMELEQERQQHSHTLRCRYDKTRPPPGDTLCHHLRASVQIL